MKVCDKPCDQCLFSKGRIVSAARVKEVLSECKRNDQHFICHKASIFGHDVCCRTFYDTKTSNLIRIMQRLRFIQFVNPTTGEPTP
jgi:hypothetical protein